jgi:tRNA(Glu) U13 pseudouridine synthase TruD
VIPIIGTQVKYPRNETYEVIKSILNEESINIEDLIFKENFFNSKGHYRKFVQIPKNIEFDFVQHDDQDEDLLNENYNVEPHPVKNGTKFTSLRLVFQLPQSTYATMLFRELTRSSSDSKVQAGLSQKINEN